MNRTVIPGALLVVLIGGAILIAAIAVVSAVAPPATGTTAGTTWIGNWLWEDRGLDLVAQSLLVLAGVFGVLFVLGREES